MADRNLAWRYFVWNVCFFALCLFCILYLKDKPEIKNFDVVFPFLPLVFLAFSTEIFKIKQFKIFAIIDFVLKLLSYIFAQLIFRRIATGAYFWTCIALFSACAIVSFSFSLTSIIKSKKF